MGVMQVARPLKPQDSRCVTYLADANSRKKSLDAFDIDGVSQGKCAKNVFVSKKAYRDLTRSVAFSEDLTSCVKLRRKYEFEKQGIRVDLNLQVVESNSCSTGQDSEQTLSSLGENADECIVSSLTKRVDQLLKSYRDGKTTVRNGWYIEPDVSGLDLDDLKRIEIISNDIEGEIVRCYKERQDHPSWNETEMKRVTRRKVPDMKVQTCGRGRPRKKSLGKRGSNSCDKQSSQDGSENGEGRTSRGRQQRNGGQGNGGSGGGRRRRDDDDREDDNDDIEDDFDENNEDDDEEDDEQTGTESVADETELTPEQEAEMAQELLCLIPPKNMNCDPPEKPAKPGTAVNLHGVVLHETTGGLVVLNVRWRNKIYSGALIDVRKSRWASERIKPDPYPEGAHVKPADLIKLNGKRKGKKAKSPDLTEKDSKEPIDIKSEQPFKEPSGVPVSFKRPSDASNGDSTDAGVKKKARLSPPPIECPEPNCGKRYSHKNGLKYHQAHAHQNKSEAEEAKPAVVITIQRTSGTDTEPTSTTTLAQQKIVVDQKPQIDQQSIGQFSVAVAKPIAEASTGSTTAVKKIKTEEESAVDSIKDVKFEEAEKNKEGLPDVPKIMLESSTGEGPTELIGASEGGKMEVARPENLFATGSQASLMPFNSRANYAQFSPTLNPLNPQTINNSLSNALQTASTKSTEKFESDGEKRAVHGPEGERVESRDDSRSKLRLDELATVSADPASIAATVRRFGFDKDIKCEDVVPSSPDDLAPGIDLLPGSLGSHLFAKETKSGFGVVQSIPTGFGSDPSEFPASTYSALLYNQTRLDHATKLFTGGDFSVPEDFAELNVIRKAVSDAKPHFSPKLLEFLIPTQKARETAPDTVPNADEVSTSSKGESSGKPSRKAERKDASSPSSTSFAPMTSGGRGDQIVPGRERPSGGTLMSFTGAPQKSDFLQPNISVGRPIVKPASKPESITGGQKIMAGTNRFGSHGHFSAGDKQSEEAGQSENQTANEARDQTPKNLSPTPYVDKQMIEAKTWIPKEVYWQSSSKKGLGSERTQFSPSKEKMSREQSAPIRMGSEMERKSGSPFDHGGVPAEYIRSHGTSPSQSIRKGKQSSIPYSGPPMPGSGMDGDRAKQLDRHSDSSQDGSDMPRFTLSGERSSSSPADNRGRPRKIRVEKTQQIPVGNAKDIEGSRGAPDHSSRKQTTTCSYTRTSVIHSMTTPPEDIRSVPSVKEEYVSPEGKRKSPAVSQERLNYEKKGKQDYRKTEAGRIFEAEREKLKTRHVESHYANEVRNMQLRAQELAGLPKSDIPIRGSLSPGSRFQSLSVAALEKGDRHARERLDAKSMTVSPAYGQGSSFSTHPSDIEKFRPEYLQHEPHRLPTPFGSSLPDGYPGIPVPYSGSSYYGQRAGISQGESLAHQRFEQLIASQMDAKYDKGVSLKLAQEASKHSHADRLRPSSRDGHSSRLPFYPHASPLAFQSREPGSAPRSPKGSPFDYRLVQHMESGIISKESKTPIGDSLRDVRREFGHPYGFFTQPFHYQNLSSSKPYAQRLSEQRSPYKHPSELEKSRYPSHSSSQAHSGPGGMISANLILTKADSLGYGSVHYENRNPDSKK